MTAPKLTPNQMASIQALSNEVGLRLFQIIGQQAHHVLIIAEPNGPVHSLGNLPPHLLEILLKEIADNIEARKYHCMPKDGGMQ